MLDRHKSCRHKVAVLDRSASLYRAILICFSSQFHVIKKGNCNVLSCNSDLFLRTVGLYFPNLEQKNKNNCDFIVFFTPLLSSYSES